MNISRRDPLLSLSKDVTPSLPVFSPSATVLVESPFFLKPATNVVQGLQSNHNGPSSTASVFPLTKLPIELQLRILWHCVVSSLPILNAGVPKGELTHDVEGETPGQRRISPQIIFTCKAYYSESMKLLYTNNTFLYSSEKPPQKWPGVKKISKGSVESLIIRSMCTPSQSLPQRAAEISMYWLRFFQKVTKLQIDFCCVGSGFEDVWDEDEDKFALLVEFVDYVIVENMHKDVDTNGLEQLTLTGLPENDLGLFIVKAFSLLTRKQGKIGIGTGEGGKRYQLIQEEDGLSLGNTPQKVRHREPEIVWIQREDVAGLIKRAASDECSRWLFEDFDLVSN
ncbi:MAG: hypothetical protein LQ351_006417 [Letrouitia transgressa]|nr:MAG: hypothetical protein LQ351_006417 [Letrouitia transgressa]